MATHDSAAPQRGDSAIAFVGGLVVLVVFRRHDPDVVKFKELRVALRQQDKASHEVAPVGQVDMEKICARCQIRHAEP